LLCLSPKLSPPTLHLWLGKICYCNFDVLCRWTKVFITFLGRKIRREEKMWQGLLMLKIRVLKKYKGQHKAHNLMFRIGVSKKYKGQHKPHNPLLYMSPNLSRNGREEKKWQRR
jgi:hypothetical protein